MRRKIYIPKKGYGRGRGGEGGGDEKEGNKEIAGATEKVELLSGKEYKREDVRGNGRNPNGIGSGNRSGGTTWRRIGVSLAGTWSVA